MFFKSKKLRRWFPRFQSSTPWVIINTLGDIWGETIRIQVLVGDFFPIRKIRVKMGIFPKYGWKSKIFETTTQRRNDRKSSAPSNEFVHVVFRVGCKTQPRWVVMIFFVGKQNCKNNWQKITLSQPLSWSLCDSFVFLLPVHVTSLHLDSGWSPSNVCLPRGACKFETYTSSVLKMDLSKDP